MKNPSRAHRALFAFFAAFFAAWAARGAESGVSAGRTLLEAPGARAAALGEAFVAAADDVTALGFNPAALATLRSSHVSFLYQSGVADDAFGHVAVGGPAGRFGWGAAVAAYEGPEATVPAGAGSRRVTAQRDWTGTLGISGSVGGAAIGVAGKVLRSELAETARATAYAADAGITAALNSRLRVAAALQNIGTKLTYLSEGDPLPALIRGGLAWTVARGAFPATLFVDAPYLFNEADFRPAAGFEVRVGPLALRAGYRSGRDIESISAGTGLAWGPATLDYAFGLVDEFDSRHRVSVGVRWGAGADSLARAGRAPVVPFARMDEGRRL